MSHEWSPAGRPYADSVVDDSLIGHWRCAKCEWVTESRIAKPAPDDDRIPDCDELVTDAVHES
ncbi:MAG: hypothetical protein BWY99_01671 [Synergistetes bacterium ADurb.BinA166]|nr:MAG: hypothetical protein BWY99_01671 [Synergistetes bacterium ADurb.BinA166]